MKGNRKDRKKVGLRLRRHDLQMTQSVIYDQIEDLHQYQWSISVIVIYN